MNKQRKKIGIDARFYGTESKGLGRYTQELVDGILAADQENEYVIFLRKDNFASFKTNRQNVRKVEANVRWYTAAEQLLMPWLIWRERLDLIHFPHFNVPLFCPCPFLVTIHDLILIRYPTRRASRLGPMLYRIKNWGYKRVIKNAIKKSKKIIAVSKFTKQDIENIFQTDGDKIKVIYEGVARTIDSQGAGADDKKVLFHYNISKPYLLYVGNAYPHKNLEMLLRVFEKIYHNKQDIQLVFVGKEDYFYAGIKQLAVDLGLFSREKPEESWPCIFTGYVSDFDLDILYRQSLAYVFPSLYEGFGLPPLEAAAKSLPVISSDRGSMPEILGDAALYFNPEDESDIEQKLCSIISDQKLRADLANNGRVRVLLYDWQICARETLGLYNQILNEKER